VSTPGKVFLTFIDCCLLHAGLYQLTLYSQKHLTFHKKVLWVIVLLVAHVVNAQLPRIYSQDIGGKGYFTDSNGMWKSEQEHNVISITF